MKGQSLLIEFLMFFLINLSLLILLGNFFSLYSSRFKDEAEALRVENLKYHLSSFFILIKDTLKNADFVKTKILIPNFTQNCFIEINGSYGLRITTYPSYHLVQSSLHNLNRTSLDMNGFSSCGFNIILISEKPKNKIELKYES